MPLVYGEEDDAFVRLQEELIQNTNDHSVFAWIDSNVDTDGDDPCGLLAKSPADFSKSKGIGPIYYPYISNPCSISNQGFRIDLHLKYLPEQNLYSTALDCSSPSMAESDLGILLKRSNYTEHQYARIKAHKFHRVCREGDVRTVYIPQTPSVSHFREQREPSVYSVPNSGALDLLKRADHRNGDVAQVTFKARQILAKL